MEKLLNLGNRYASKSSWKDFALAKGLMDYISRPEKEYGVNKIKGVAKIAKSLKEIEPSLAPTLQKGIDRIQSL